MGKSWFNRRQAETNRWDVFSSASRRDCAGLFVTRCLDLLGECLGVCERSLDQYARPPEMARCLFYRFGFLVHGELFPHGNPMPGQVRLAPCKGVAKRDAWELRLETLFDDVPRDEIALRRPGGACLFGHQPLVMGGHAAGHVCRAHDFQCVHTVHKSQGSKVDRVVDGTERIPPMLKSV